ADERHRRGSHQDDGGYAQGAAPREPAAWADGGGVAGAAGAGVRERGGGIAYRSSKKHVLRGCQDLTFFRRGVRGTEASMKPIAPLVAIAAALVLMLTTTPSWGQTGVNPTVSDASFNTAGGTVALGTCLGKTVAPCSSLQNTAFGFGALRFNTGGQ